MDDNINIKHSKAGRAGVKSAQRNHLEKYLYRLKYSTLNVAGIAGLYDGVNWVLEEGIKKIHTLKMDLSRQLLVGLKTIERIETYCTDDLKSHIGVISFNFQAWNPSIPVPSLMGNTILPFALGCNALRMVHKQIGTDKLHGTVRIGFGPFNTSIHVEKAIDAIRETAMHYAR